METFAKGEIVLFEFPFSDLSSRKLRPCLVLSEIFGDDIVLCQITSQHISKDSYSLPLQSSELVIGSLYIDSFIRCNKLFTATVSQISRTVGRISNEKYSQVVRLVKDLIDKK